MYCLQETCLICRHKRLKAKRWKVIFHPNRKLKRAVVVIISNNTDFKSKEVTRGKEGHYILIKVQYIKKIKQL